MEALIVLGAVFAGAAIVGGGIKAAGSEVPSIKSLSRQILLGIFGVILIILGVALDDDSEPPPTTSAASTLVSSTTPPTSDVPATTEASTTTIETTTTRDATTTTEGTTTTESPVLIPNSIDYTEVAQVLEAAGVPTVVSFSPDRNIPSGTIIEISPQQGTDVSDRRVVVIRVSTGERSSTLSDIVSRGAMRLGINSAGATGLVPQEDGSFAGAHLDAIQAAFEKLLGGAVQIEFTPLTAVERFTALANGEVDLMLNGLSSSVQSFEAVLYPIDGATQVAAMRESAFAAEFRLNIERVLAES